MVRGLFHRCVLACLVWARIVAFVLLFGHAQGQARSLSLPTWDVSTLVMLSHVQCASFSADGQSIVSVSWDDDRGGISRISLVSVLTGEVRTLIGPNMAGFQDGGPQEAQFSGPTDAVFSPDGKWIAVADTANNRIRRVQVATGVVTTLAGTSELGFVDGPAMGAKFRYCRSLSFSPDGSWIAIAGG